MTIAIIVAACVLALPALFLAAVFIVAAKLDAEIEKEGDG